MRGVVALTDYDWYRYCLSRPELDEVNFWRPGTNGFTALAPGEPFFFKLKAPRSEICGFGLFARFALLPIWQAWDLFGTGNGVLTQMDLMKRLNSLQGGANSGYSPSRVIGCIAIADPVFFAPDEWVDGPADWKPQIVSGKGYDLGAGEGARIHRECLERVAARKEAPAWSIEQLDRARTGKPQVASCLAWDRGASGSRSSLRTATPAR